MYEIVLSVHNVLRWVVLAAGIVAVLRAVGGWRGAQPWTASSAGAGRLFTISLDVQFLIGILLYGMLSPVTRQAFTNFGAAMGSRDLRFFAVEHALLMVLALMAAHVGKVRAPRAPTDARRHRTAALWYGLALLFILIGMPWFRPLLRIGG